MQSSGQYMSITGHVKCNAALYSRQKKHSIFDRINTITALSFRWPRTAVNWTVQSNRNLPAWIVCTIMLPAAYGPDMRDSLETGFGIVWKIFQAEQRGEVFRLFDDFFKILGYGFGRGGINIAFVGVPEYLMVFSLINLSFTKNGISHKTADSYHNFPAW